MILIAVGVILVATAVVLLIPWLRQRVLQAFSGSSEKHIAVLPFDNIGNYPENDALVQGLMDSLAGKLSNLDVANQSLWIVPTSEVRRLKIADPADALKQLGANLVVKGSVERDGRDVRQRHINFVSRLQQQRHRLRNRTWAAVAASAQPTKIAVLRTHSLHRLYPAR